MSNLEKNKFEFLNKFTSEIINSILNYKELHELEEVEVLEDSLKNYLSSFQEKLKINEYTILHIYIEYYYYHFIWKKYDLIKREHDLEYFIEDIPKIIQEIEAVFSFYNQTLPKEIKRKNPFFDKKYLEELLEKDETTLEEAKLFFEVQKYIEKLLERLDTNVFQAKKNENMIHEIYSSIYSNLPVLSEFNRLISEQVALLRKEKYPHLLKRDGVFYRVKYIPKWLQGDIQYRDRGVCQICKKDLSGVGTRTQSGSRQYDHIIPLDKGGINDATNIQLTCVDCNNKKHNHTPIISYNTLTFSID